MDLFDLLNSRRLLAGGAVERKTRFVYEEHRPWLRRVVDADVYLEVLARRREEKPNEIDCLAELCQELSKAFTIIERGGIGRGIRESHNLERRIEAMILNHPSERSLAQKIASVSGADANEVFIEHLQGLGYVHLRLMSRSLTLCHGIEFRLLDVLWNSYNEGLLPFGVFDGSLDESYAGDDILLCLNPACL